MTLVEIGFVVCSIWVVLIQFLGNCPELVGSCYNSDSLCIRFYYIHNRTLFIYIMEPVPLLPEFRLGYYLRYLPDCMAWEIWNFDIKPGHFSYNLVAFLTFITLMGAIKAGYLIQYRLNVFSPWRIGTYVHCYWKWMPECHWVPSTVRWFFSPLIFFSHSFIRLKVDSK